MEIILGESQNLVRAGLRRLLEDTGLVHIAAEVTDGQQLLEQVGRLRPYAVITELRLSGASGISGIEMLHQLQRHYPEVKALVLSAQTDANSVRQAIKQGAAGFLSKDAELPELTLALRALERNQIYLSPSVSHGAIDRRRHARPEDHVALTPRQRQVLHLIGRGKTTKEIAALIGVSIKTVETHRMRLMQSLGLRGTQALMLHALRLGYEAGEH